MGAQVQSAVLQHSKIDLAGAEPLGVDHKQALRMISQLLQIKILFLPRYGTYRSDLQSVNCSQLAPWQTVIHLPLYNISLPFFAPNQLL